MNNNNISRWSRFAFFSISMLSCSLVFAAQTAAPFTSGTRYDLTGSVTGIILPDPDGSGPLLYPATRNTYENSLLVKTERGQLSSWQDENTAPVNWSGFTVETTTIFAYDSYGRKAVQAALDKQLAVKKLTQINYDTKGRVNCKVVRMNPMAYTPQTFSSLPNACTASSTPNGYDRVTLFTYDNLDQVLTETRAHNTALSQVYVTNTYYPSTRLLKTQTDANGNVTELRYDTTERLEYRVYPSKTLAGQVNEADYNSYSYDANSNVEVERKRNGDTVTYTYDNNNRLIKKDFSNNTYSGDIFYNYDLRGLTLHSRFGSDSGQGVTNTFDGFGNVDSSTTNMGGVNRTLTYQYDNNSNRTRVTHPDNVYFGYTFDGINRVTGATENASSLLSLTYRPNGKRHTINRASGAATTYTFDDLSRLESLQQNFNGTANDLTNTFSYNPANQVVQLTQSNNLYSYVGNANKTGAYVPNGLNQYTSIKGLVVTYDNNGNLTRDTSESNQGYTYDLENRLVSTTDGVTSSFVYDPLGRLFQTTINGVVTQFLYDGDALVAEYNSSNTLTRRYVHGDQVDEPWVEYAGSNTGANYRTYLHADHQGSIIARTDGTGNYLGKLTYDSFGIPAATNVGRFGYTGQIWMGELGVFHYKARMYSPKLGRFLQTDPIFYADNMNMYAYVGNDPVNMIDPTGKNTVAGAAAGCAVTGPACPAGAVVGAVVGTVAGAEVADAVSETLSGKEEGIPEPNTDGPEMEPSEVEPPPARDDVKPDSTQREKDVPNRAEPNEVIEGKRRTREYDETGKPMRDYDKPHQGDETDHVHEWPNGQREHPGRPYSPWPR